MIGFLRVHSSGPIGSTLVEGDVTVACRIEQRVKACYASAGSHSQMELMS